MHLIALFCFVVRPCVRCRTYACHQAACVYLFFIGHFACAGGVVAISLLRGGGDPGMRAVRLMMRGVFVVLLVSLLTVALPLARAQEPSFARSVYPILEQAGCANCHNSNGVASATRLHFPEPGATAERLDALGKSLVILVDRDHPENSLLLRKPTKRVAHGGGERIKAGSPEEATLLSWIG